MKASWVWRPRSRCDYAKDNDHHDLVERMQLYSLFFCAYFYVTLTVEENAGVEKDGKEESEKNKE